MAPPTPARPSATASPLARAARLFEAALEIVAILLMVGLTAIVVYSVVMRSLGASPSWYDEVASIMLAWLTYYAGALAALRRGHIGFDGLLMAMPLPARLACAVFAEIVVIAFFVILALMGLRVLDVLEGSTLISLPWVPVQLTQSVIPIGAALFILAELMSLPGYFAKLRAGVSIEMEEIQHAIHEAERELGADGEAILRGQSVGAKSVIEGGRP